MTRDTETLRKPSQDALEATIEQQLRLLRITGNLKGLRYHTNAIASAIRRPDLTISMTRDLYPLVADRCRATVSGVERAMRTAVKACWERGGRETLDQMAGYHLTERPTNAEFIDLIANYISRRM